MQIAQAGADVVNLATAGEASRSAPSQPTDSAPAMPGAVDSERLTRAADTLTQTARLFATNLQFTVDDETGIRVIKVVDTETQEVIRQIPPEETLTLAKTLNHLSGLLMREKA